MISKLLQVLIINVNYGFSATSLWLFRNKKIEFLDIFELIA